MLSYYFCEKCSSNYSASKQILLDDYI